MARPEEGQLIWRRTRWYGRFWAVVDGERIRVCRALGANNKAVAKRKLQRLVNAEQKRRMDKAVHLGDQVWFNKMAKDRARLKLLEILPDENQQNRLLRFWFEKGSDLSVHTPEDLRQVAAKLNRRPRPTLNLETPANRLNKLLHAA